MNPVPARSSKEVLSITLPVEVANEMFSTEFSYFMHTATGSRHMRTMEYHLPEHLTECIEHIHPTIQYVYQVIRNQLSLLLN